ncbi:ATP-dependent helicase HrpB [Desulfogranum marinum]|uniref:ATP-dependent helicase HrpB n=1 Tax=Desulfogranum marinum TaxID=453220 RepID=UPI0029C7440C|nr:ATP-dependent helicase HrpB [Desulfogranum marinum]
MHLPDLPIHTVIPELKKALRYGSAVLAAPPGSGKTTIVPLTLLNAPWLKDKKILILEPRRLATRAAAARMATLLGEQVSRTVGYQIRFDRRVSQATRIEVVTEGILTRRIQEDNELQDIGLIIFDEFHERSIHADLALALCLDLCQLREDLRILVMSATLDTAPIAELLGNVPVIQGEGRTHPVNIDYLPQQPTGRIADTAAAGIRRVFNRHPGDILAFLPGAGEINDVAGQLKDTPGFDNEIIAPLYGNLSQKEQDQAIIPDPNGRRRIILSTSIAETSLTIEGISWVIDSGWSRKPQFHPGSGLSRLKTVRVSKAVAEQRAGRAGRLGPGNCLRLWTQQEHYSLAPFHPPEIVDTDLAQLVLELALWGVTDPAELRWLTPPRQGAYQQAKELLFSLEALTTSGRITSIGKKLAGLAMHPRLGYMLLKGQEKGLAALACDLAALLSERDIVSNKVDTPTTDLQSRLQLLSLWRRKETAAVKNKGGNPGACSRVDRNARTWMQRLQESRKPCDTDLAGILLSFAYPDRVGRRRHDKHENYLMASGRGAILPQFDPLTSSEYIVTPHLDAGSKQGRIFLAASLSLAELRKQHSNLFSKTTGVYWDDDTAKVIAVDRLCLGAIVVEEKSAKKVSPDQISLALLSGIKSMGIGCLPWNRESRQLQARINCLRSWQPNGPWPDLSNKHLLDDLSWLTPYLTGISKAKQLKQLNLQEIFMNMLGWENQQHLKRLAPSTLTVASGSRIRLTYQPDESPLLAVRIQEVFGMQQTPVICDGTIPVLVHLLSPAQRPIQVTTDLAGFWQRTYPEVKKELKGRYPKHFWPDDPLTAIATRRTKKNIKQPKNL